MTAGFLAKTLCLTCHLRVCVLHNNTQIKSCMLTKYCRCTERQCIKQINNIAFETIAMKNNYFKLTKYT